MIWRVGQLSKKVSRMDFFKNLLELNNQKRIEKKT